MATIDRRGATVGAADPPIATNPNPDLAIKAPVRVATTGSNIVLSGLQTIDGVALAAADRVLVKDQTDQTTNGLYNASTGIWTRTIDANNNSQFSQGCLVIVGQGTANTNTTFELSSANPITLGTTAITYITNNVPATRRINTTAPLAGGASLALDVTLSLTINGSLQVTGGALAVAASAAVPHQWVSSINASGVPQLTQPNASDIANGAALTQVSDTNVTLTLGGSPATALIAAASITAGWTGTLAAGRLNANVVQGITNDTNVTGSIAAQVLTLGWTGQLSPARGGTGVNNGTSTITVGGNFAVSGAFAATLTVTATTNSTLPAGTHTLAGLDVAQTWTALQQFADSDFALKGATSGTITLKAAAVAGSNTITWPAGTTDFSSTGGTSQVLKQTSSGGAFTVAQLAASDLSNGTTGSNSVVLGTGPTISGGVFTGTSDVQQAFQLSGAISPTALSGDVNDYNPAGLSTCSVIRQDGGAANRNITGLTAQSGGRVIVLENIGASNSLVLKDSSASSAAANRFLLGADITLAQQQTAILWYDATSSRWRCLGVFVSGGGGAGTVTSITIGAGLASTQSPLTTSGTMSVSLSSVTNSLGADVALNNTGNYFDGPSVAQGGTGTWFASGTVTVTDTGSTANVNVKLWDGTTVIASTRAIVDAVAGLATASISGVITSPAGNIRISCQDAASTNGKILFNSSGNSKDSTVTAVRIA